MQNGRNPIHLNIFIKGASCFWCGHLVKQYKMLQGGRKSKLWRFSFLGLIFKSGLLGFLMESGYGCLL